MNRRGFIRTLATVPDAAPMRTAAWQDFGRGVTSVLHGTVTVNRFELFTSDGGLVMRGTLSVDGVIESLEPGPGWTCGPDEQTA